MTNICQIADDSRGNLAGIYTGILILTNADQATDTMTNIRQLVCVKYDIIVQYICLYPDARVEICETTNSRPIYTLPSYV